MKEFKADCERRGMSHSSTISYQSSIRLFFKFLEERKVEITDVDKETLKAFIDHLKNERGVCYKTMGYQFSALAAFYDWIVFEEKLKDNPVIPVRTRYLKRYKGGAGFEEEGRKLITVEEMAKLVRFILPARDRAIVITLAKTGIRRGELVRLDVDDVDMGKMSIKLKPTAKRSNRLVFFDEEARKLLSDWLIMRRSFSRADCPALFITDSGGRINKNHVYNLVVKNAERVGLHIPTSERLEDRFTPHCCRHWFTTHLMRTGMPREHVQELRGDARPEAIDIYYHIDPEELRKSYLAHMPRLGL